MMLMIFITMMVMMIKILIMIVMITIIIMLGDNYLFLRVRIL